MSPESYHATSPSGLSRLKMRIVDSVRTCLEPDGRKQIWKATRRFLVHPIFPVVVFSLLSTFLYKIDRGSKGEFYPFSNFPMYANPRNRDLEYFFLEHGDGKPLASFGYTGYTASRVKKLMRSESMVYGTVNGLKWNKKSSWLTDEVREEIGTTVLARLRKRSLDRSTPFPGDIALARGLIFVNEEGELEDNSVTIATNRAEVPAEADQPPSAELP